MRGLLALFFVFWPFAGGAQVVPVQSGAHEGFSRLVFEPGEGSAWSLFRTAEGYALRIDGREGFDLSSIFERIGHERLEGIWVDPASATLQLRLDCACHALPYELEPGVLVVDLRDGVAPEGSSFEMDAEGHLLPPLQAERPTRPRRRAAVETEMASEDQGYDWTTMALDEAGAVVDAELDLMADTKGVRDALYHQLAEGAAQGVVEMELPKELPDSTGELDKGLPLRVGQELGLITLPGGKDGVRDMVTLEGQTCPSHEELALSSWGRAEPVALGLGLMRQGLTDEKDKVLAGPRDQAMRYYLHLGFGAEARQLQAAMGPNGPEGRLLRAVSWAVDGQNDPEASLRTYASCDTPAALWAALSTPQGAALTDLNHGALQRAFADLPPHLRLALGPALARQFLDMNEVEQARLISASIQRGGGALDAATALVQAHVDLATGDPSAEAAVENLAGQGGSMAPQALMDLVAIRQTAGQAVAPEHITALAALAQEFRGERLGQDLRRSLAIALATAGRFDEAFAEQATLREDLPAVWQMLTAQAQDDAFLRHAVLPEGQATPELGWVDRRAVADRLDQLGLPDPALDWLADNGKPDPDPQATQTLRARLQADRFDPAATLTALSGIGDASAASLRGGALLALDRPAEAAKHFAASGDSAGLARAQRQSQEWGKLPPGEALWPEAAALLQPTPAIATDGPLARSQALLDESQTARALLDQLIKANPLPSP